MAARGSRWAEEHLDERGDVLAHAGTETSISRYWGGCLFSGLKSEGSGTGRLVDNVYDEINRW